MSMDNSDDECQILESGLLVQNHKRIKIFFDGFPVEDLVELVESVKKYGGETSESAGTGIVTLSDPMFHAKTERTRYHVNWLYDTIEFNEIQDLLVYKLHKTVNPILKAEIRKEENEEVDESTSAELETQADEETQERSEPQPGPSGIVKLKKKYPYTDAEKKAMIQYLVHEDAISQAGGRKIWQKMLDDDLIQNHTAASMATHFSSSLKYKIPEYIEDPNIIEQFQEQEDERQRKKRRRR